MNKVILIGNLARDPEVSSTTSGKTVAKFSIAVKRQGQKDKADFINIVAWEKLADLSVAYLKKGNKIAVTGSLNIDSYEKDGNRVYITSVVASEFEFLTPKAQQEEGFVNDKW